MNKSKPPSSIKQSESSDLRPCIVSRQDSLASSFGSRDYSGSDGKLPGFLGHSNRSITVNDLNPRQRQSVLTDVGLFSERSQSLYGVSLSRDWRWPSITNTRVFTRRPRTSLPVNSSLRGKEKFRLCIRQVLNLLKFLNLLKWITNLSVREGETFTDTSDDMQKEIVHRNRDLYFDLSHFKAQKEVQLSRDVRHTLSISPSQRTQEQISNAVYGLQHLKAFAEYPMEIQERLCKAAWFQEVPPRRVIIRQGHYAENFYCIVSGQAFVRILEKNEATGETLLSTVSILKQGTSFGELALLHHSTRTATVVSRDTVQLLTISREDFVNIFMTQNGSGEPDHVRFLYSVPLLKEWPISRIQDRPQSCLCHYFKRGVLIVVNSQHSDWLYIVKSGSCQVLKKLKAAKRHSRDRGKTQTTRIHQDAKNVANIKSTEGSEPPVFIQLDIIKPKDIFGLTNLNFDDEIPDEELSVSLVSNGAECVMLSKKFFVECAGPLVRQQLRETIRPYPSDHTLQMNLQVFVDWRTFKQTAINETVSQLQRPKEKDWLHRASSAIH